MEIVFQTLRRLPKPSARVCRVYMLALTAKG